MLLAACAAPLVVSAQSLSTAFTYWDQLTGSEQPASGL